MYAAALTPNLRAVTPELARRMGLILGALAAVVARRFLREPALAGLIVTLWHRLNRVARRFEQAVLRPRPQRVRAKRVVVADAPVVAPRPRVPGGRMWLVKVLGWEAVGHGSQLSALLAEPEMRAVLEAVPAVGRILRPVCRMLGIEVPGAIAVVPVVRVRKPRAPRQGAAGAERRRTGATWFRGPLFKRW